MTMDGYVKDLESGKRAERYENRLANWREICEIMPEMQKPQNSRYHCRTDLTLRGEASGSD